MLYSSPPAAAAAAAVVLGRYRGVGFAGYCFSGWQVQVVEGLAIPILLLPTTTPRV